MRQRAIAQLASAPALEPRTMRPRLAGINQMLLPRSVDADYCRAIAQLASAPALGAGGRGFESHWPDNNQHRRKDVVGSSPAGPTNRLLTELDFSFFC